jgi:zinc protease
VTAPATVADASFSYNDFGPPGPVVSRTEAADLGIIQTRFANGVMLNVKRTAFDKDSVSVTARFGDGLRALPKTQPGLGLWISNAFVNAGLGRHSIDELQRVLAGRAWSLDIDIADDAFSLNAVVPPAELALQLQLMAALASDPGYRPEAFEQFAQSIAVWYPTLGSTPQGVLGRDLGRIVHSGDPRWGVPLLAEIQARTPAEIRAVLNTAMLYGPMEISIVGDVDVDAAIGAVARTFGALPARTGAFDLTRNASDVRFPAPPGAPIVLTHTGDADKAAVAVSWPGIDETDLRQARVLRLLRDVFDVKMTDEVRERLAATYSPGVTASASDIFRGYGYVQATVDARASDVEAVLAAISDVASRMRAGEISTDEFERARTPLLEQINQRFERNGYWLDVLSQSQSRPGWLDRTRTIKQDYAGITLDDVKALAARIFVPEKAVTVKVLAGAPPAGTQADPARQAGQ